MAIRIQEQGINKNSNKPDFPTFKKVIFPLVADPKSVAFLTPGPGIRDGNKIRMRMNIPDPRELRNNFLG
jgi:hypothetical protein